MKISAIVLTFNSQAVIASTLDSALAVANEIFVVDSYSTDATPEIAKRYGAHFVQRKFENYGEQRNWAIDNLPLAHNWELHLDADERLTKELIEEINGLKARPRNVEGYYIARLTYFLGRPIQHGGMYPIWHLRLFRRGVGRCETRLYDQHFYVAGRTGRLRHPFIDDQQNSLAEWTSRHNRWSDAEAMEVRFGHRQGVVAARLGGTPVEQKRALRKWYYRAPLLFRALLLFFYRYVLRFGFLDGREGLVFFVLQTFWYRFLVDAKIYEARLSSTRSPVTSVPAPLPGRELGPRVTERTENQPE